MPSVVEPQTPPDGGSLYPKVGKKEAPLKRGLDIIDIRSAAVEVSLKDEILTMFHPKKGPRKLPTLLLYDERGLQLFEDVSFPLA